MSFSPGVPPALLSLIVLLLLLASGLRASAQPAPLPLIYQFDFVGILQSATLSDTVDLFSGGLIRVNGIECVIPKNTVVTLPAAAITWREMFELAPEPWGLQTTPPTTGLALDDTPKARTSYEIRVVGNTVRGSNIVGQIFLSHEFLNSASGFINFMDYSVGEFRLGGVLNDGSSGTRVRLNDPATESGSGRFGRPSPTSVDRRFQVDQENPTVTSASGYPMCFPRVDPLLGDDALCPRGNRPVDPATGFWAQSFDMRDPTGVALDGFPDRNPFQQAPIKVGDFVNVLGTIQREVTDAATGAGFDYISAHTVSANTAIYTHPGTTPAYVSIEVTIMGMGGVTTGVAEATIRSRFEGSTTDSSAIIHLTAVDYDPVTGEAIDREWGRVGVDPGPPNGAVRGRWRYRPPCENGTPSASVCTSPPGDVFLPAPREVRAAVEGAVTLPIGVATPTAANGIIFGQFRAPIFEYIFAENRPGFAQVTNNFESMPFLVNGGSSSAVSGLVVGLLDPWPGLTAPTPGNGGCFSPIAAAGGPYTAPSGGSITLTGQVMQGTTPTVRWSATGGSLAPVDSLVSQYTAPSVSAVTVFNLALTLSNACGTSISSTTVTVSGPTGPTVQLPAAIQIVVAGQTLSVALSGTDPAGLALSFQVAGVDAASAAVPVGIATTGIRTATASFTPTLPAGSITPLSLTFRVTATNTVDIVSPPAFFLISVSPPSDSIILTTLYRIGKQRLVITAASSIVNPGVLLTLQPYIVASTGVTFDPTLLGNTFVNEGAGVHTITLVGAPQPIAVVVTSSIGGTSANTPMQRIRL